MTLFSGKSQQKQAAFFVATVEIKDPAKFAEYAQKAGATFKPFGGEPVLRGKFDGTLAGTASNHQAIGVVRFESADRLREWYACDAYQALIPLRDAAANMTIATYEIPA